MKWFIGIVTILIAICGASYLTSVDNSETELNEAMIFIQSIGDEITNYRQKHDKMMPKSLSDLPAHLVIVHKGKIATYKPKIGQLTIYSDIKPSNFLYKISFGVIDTREAIGEITMSFTL